VPTVVHNGQAATPGLYPGSELREDFHHKPPVVTIIVPTRNEAPNVAPLVSRIGAALGSRPGRPGTPWEVMFVDDSDDDTPHAVRAVGVDAPVHLLHRPPGARPEGLGGAVLKGFGAARGAVLVVMDADLQHPPELLPHLIRPILNGKAELVSGTRYVKTGATDGLSGPWRRTVSSSSRLLVHLLVPRSRCLSDPMSGLFAIDRRFVEGIELRPNGFKILLEVAARTEVQRVHNVAYHFAPRNAGVSKASLKEGARFARHLLSLVRVRHQLRRLPPVRGTESGPAGTEAHDGATVRAIA
jgi:glycosyltransferase involved in cell wall biosynthesis